MRIKPLNSVHTKFIHLHIMKKCISVITGILGFVGVAFAQGTPNTHANDPAFAVHSAPV
jgi:hypothetical protein